MKYRHDKPSGRPGRVAEPVQVYLDPADRERLERLATRLGATKSDVLRRGLTALESSTRATAQPDIAAALPTFRGNSLQAGVDLDNTAALLERMDQPDAPG